MSALAVLYQLVLVPFHLLQHTVSPQLLDLLRLLLAGFLFLLADVLVVVLLCWTPEKENWAFRLGQLVSLALVGAAAVTWPPAVVPVWALYPLLSVTVLAHLLCVFGLPALLRRYAPAA
jgi:hypothetical protein